MRALLLLALAYGTAHAQDLPVKDKSLESEAAELIEGLPNLTELPLKPDATGPIPVAKAQARLEAARQKQQRWEKLARQGVLSRMEAERCQVEVANALLVYERACCAEALAGHDPAAIASCQARLTAAQSNLHQTQLTLARNNLARFRKLRAENLVSAWQLNTAESRVKQLEDQVALAESPPAPAHPKQPVPSIGTPKGK